MPMILIVDDEQVFRNAMTVALSKEGYQIETAANGQRALEILKTQTPDLILLDLNMPQMDGTQFLYTLRNDLKLEIPCIVLTNLSEGPTQGHVQDYLIKSNVSLSDIIAKVRELIG